jgi:uncharacterized protein (TIGR03118 family)
MNIATAPMRALVASAALTVITSAAVAAGEQEDLSTAPANAYRVTILVSNGALPAKNPTPDPNLINGWGVAFNPNGPVWVNGADSGKSVLYDGNGAFAPQPQRLVVTVPGPNGTEGNPTGIVFAGGMDFVVSNGTASGPARFIFATENGTIAAWAPNVDINNAIQVRPAAGKTPDDVYTGLALSGDGTTHLLYACDFKNGEIDVFDGNFALVHVAGGFTDPNLPKGYSPFGIQAIGGDLYVTYAKQEEAGSGEEEQGPHKGFVNVFDPTGHLIRRVASRGVLNAPWGIALAPPSFGRFGGTLLVGNLGDGRINAFSARNGKFLGTLQDTNGKPIHVDGLWGIQFGNGVAAQKSNSLFFAAGPNGEEGGAYGVIDVATN